MKNYIEDLSDSIKGGKISLEMMENEIGKKKIEIKQLELSIETHKKRIEKLEKDKLVAIAKENNKEKKQ